MSVEPKVEGADCANCPLYSSGFVPTDVPENPRFIVLGEGPGRDEVKTGRPFTGASGQLLWNSIEQVGITRDDAIVMNTVACNPRNPEGTGNRAPTKTELKACSGRVKRELAEHPDLPILAMGNSALYTFTGKATGITRSRGTPVEWEGHTVLPTFHPAFILRKNGHAWVPEWTKDLERINDLIGGQVEATDWVPAKVRVANTKKKARQLIEMLQALPSGTIVSTDFETKGFDPRDPTRYPLCLGFAWRTDRAYVLPHTHRSTKRHKHEVEYDGSLWEEVVEDLNEVLGRKDLLFLYQNGKYDVKWFWHNNCPNGRVDLDTMLLHYAMDERKEPGHNLEYLGQAFLGAPDYKTQVKDGYVRPNTDDTFEEIPPDILHQYCGEDVAVTLELWNTLEPLAREQSDRIVDEVHSKHLIHASETYARIEDRGLGCDPDKLAATGEEMDREIEALAEELRVEVEDHLEEVLPEAQVKQLRRGKPVEFNPGSPHQVAKFLFDVLELPEVKKRSTDDEVLERFDEQLGLQFAKTLRKHRHYSKFKNTYVNQFLEYLDPDGRLRTTFFLFGTGTGRLATAKPNLLNIPADDVIIKKCIVPAPGYVFIELDFKTADLRFLAIQSRDEELCQIFRDGDRDLHTEVSVDIAAVHGRGPDELIRKDRMDAKTLNFGIPYGRGAMSVAHELELDGYDEGQAYIDAWFERFPTVLDWREEQHEFLYRNRYVETLSGRRRRWAVLSEENIADAQREAIATLCQSPTNDLTMASAYFLRDLPIVLTVHDSIILEAPKLDAEALAHHSKSVMERAPRKIWSKDILNGVPLPVEVKIGPNLGEMVEVEI